MIKKGSTLFSSIIWVMQIINVVKNIIHVT